MNLPEAAKSLGLAESTLRHQIRNGKFRARKMGGRWFVSDAEVQRYREESRRKGEDRESV